MPMSANRERSLEELERAMRRTPAYAEWRPLDPGPGADVDERYAALPVTTSTWMGALSPRGFVPEGCDLDAALDRDEHVELVRTSGTTGPPMTLVWSQLWWDESERRSWSLNSAVSRIATGSHREAVLASPRCVGPGGEDGPLPLAERTLENLLFVNERPNVTWDDAEVVRMRDELWQFAPEVVEADPAYLAAFCARAEALGLALPRPAVVVLTYARPSRLHTARIERVMGAHVVSSYGSTETGYVLVSCEHGRLHQHLASCRIDLLPWRDGARVKRLLVTPFGHPFMCVLRFDVGDLAKLADGPCPCGRTEGYQFERIEGRVSDTTLRADGVPLTLAELDDAVASCPSSDRIVSYQVEQTAPGALRLRAVATGAIDEGEIRRRLERLYGPGASVEVQSAPVLEPEPSGKYATVRRR